MVDNCSLCPALASCRTHIVQTLNGQDSSILVVGGSPYEEDDTTGLPFRGVPGQMLRHFYTAAGIGKTPAHTYAVKCMAPGKRKPSKVEIDNCRQHLAKEIEDFAPKVIVALGDTALQALMGGAGVDAFKSVLDDWDSECLMVTRAYEDMLGFWNNMAPAQRKAELMTKPKKPKLPAKPKPPKAQHTALKDVAGHTLTYNGIPVVPTYNPYFITKGKWGYVDIVLSHFKKARRLAAGEQTVGTLAPSYPVIDSIDKLEALRDYLLSDDVDCIWFDCETDGGLKWMENEVLCISFSGRAGEGYVVPWLHNAGTGYPEVHPAWDDMADFQRMIEILREIFGSEKDKGGHNVLYDLREMERDRKTQKFVTALTAFGIIINGRIRDTELLSVSIEESIPHNMTSLIANHTDMPFYEDTGILAFKKNMGQSPDKMRHDYSGADADALPRLWGAMRPIAEAEGVTYVLDEITTPMLRVCRAIESHGFTIDRAKFDALCHFYKDQIAEEEDKLWACVQHRQPGWKYNYSPTLAEVLFKELGLPKSGRKTDGADECPLCLAHEECDDHDQTGAAALEDIYLIQPHPVIPILLRLKKLTKMRSTYLDGSDGKSGMLKFIRPDAKIHSTMKVSRAETGRLASEQPNQQNLPNYLHIHPKWKLVNGVRVKNTCSESTCKEFFEETYGIDSENAYHDIIIGSQPGWGIMNADWSQLEVWVLAYRLFKYVGDRVLLDILLSGVDIHLWMARQMFPDVDAQLDDGDWRKIHPDLRRKAKACIFGVGYGLTAFGYMQREHCTEDEAIDIISRYMKVVPGLKILFKMVRRNLETRGYEVNEFGRRRHIKTIALMQALRQKRELESLIREGINFPIQSGGSDLHSKATKMLFDLDLWLILSVHDSATWEFKYTDEASAELMARQVQDKMQSLARNWLNAFTGERLDWCVPVEVEWGDNWGTPGWKLDARGVVKPQHQGV